jgi:hypothetical protein
MANEKGSSTISDLLQSKAGLAAIIVALTSLLLIKPSPLNSERPTVEPGGSKSYGALQDVDARLWQDPFQAVNEATKNTPSNRLEIKDFDGKKFTLELTGSKTQNSHSPDDIFRELPDGFDCDQITLMAVMMSASPTPEAREMRLRRRYALVSALATKRFTPVDAEHIGYFKTDDQDLPGIVPFEWFERPRVLKRDENGRESIKIPSRKVLALWVDDTRFDRMPVKRSIKLFEKFKRVLANNKWFSNSKITRIVMGPSTSGNLRAMALESSKRDKAFDYSLSKEIKFYSAQATSPDSEIQQGIDNPDKLNLSDYFKKSDINFFRTIADDSAVVESLVNELEMRHILGNQGEDAPQDHIVLLSDWDTYYGRALPSAFRNRIQAVDGDDGIVKCSSIDADADVYCFQYVRGIDGILPGAAANNVKEPSRQAKPESNSTTVVSDQPDGMSQKDYLRRIAERIRNLDERLQKENPCYYPSNRCGVSAIGVLGFDVYDKLMILRALRPYFPNKVFFTTDLSASYWSPAELPFTHNMIVSSSFGLTLRPELQKTIPPFRDSYQTSFFLSVILALENNSTGAIPGLDKPRIFEIGRNGPIDLGNPDGTDPASKFAKIAKEKKEPDFESKCVPSEDKSSPITEKRKAPHISDCDTIYPHSIFEQTRKEYQTLTQLVLAVCSLVLLYLASWNVRKWVNHLFLKNEDDMFSDTPDGIVHRLHWKRIGKFFCLLLLAITASMFINNPAYSEEEPWLWFEGVSVWPSELLRLIALVVSFVLIQIVLQKVSNSEKEIAIAFGFLEEGKGKEKQPLQSIWTTLRQAISSLNNCSSILKWQSKATLKELDGKAINVNELWEEYRRLGEPKRRVCRTLLGIVPFMIFAWTSIVLSGGWSAPVRGDFAYYIDRALILPVGFLTLFLTILVIDASRLSAALISYLDDNQSDWITGTKNTSCKMIKLSNQWGLKSEHTAYWLDAQFIAERTDAIQKLIWYPLIPIFLLVIARSPIFDDWSHPAGLIATLTILLVYLITCAFLLEYGAKRMRGKASEQLGAELRALRGKSDSNDNPEIKRLENLIKEIEGLKRGAFLPLFQQPWVEAILALASGAGGLAWMGNILGTP